MTAKQKYKYIKANSIINTTKFSLECDLNDDELARIYRFYVIQPLAGESWRLRTLDSYGWIGKFDTDLDGKKGSGGLRAILSTYFDLTDKVFVYTEQNDIAQHFIDLELEDGFPLNLSFQRAVIGKISSEQTQFLGLLRHIRNCFSHGKFILVDNGTEQVFVFQDDDKNNVTARIILFKTTLLKWIEVITGGPQ
jgi:hypothetical protein